MTFYDDILLGTGLHNEQSQRFLSINLEGCGENISLHDLGNAFPFLERQEQVSEFADIISCIIRSWDRFRGKPDYRKKLVVPCIGGCSGSGKTRFVPEALQLLPEQLKSDQRHFSLLTDAVQRHLFLDVNIMDVHPSSSSVATCLLRSYVEGFSSLSVSSEDILKFIQDQKDGTEIEAAVNAIVTAESARDKDLLIFIRFDEVTEAVFPDNVANIVSLILSTHQPTSRCCLVPILSGTDIQKMQGATTASGTQFKILILAPLSFTSMETILTTLFPYLNLGSRLDNMLKNSSGPPRILQLLLWSCAHFGCCLRRQSEQGHLTPRNEQENVPSSMLSAIIKMSDIELFLSSATEYDLTRAFKHAAGNMKSSNLFKSFDVLLAHGDILYSYALTGVSVGINDKLGQYSLNDWVTRGLVCVERGSEPDKFCIVLPFMMLFQIYQEGNATANPILHLVRSPTLRLSPSEAENLDLNIVLSRLWAAYVVGERSVSLSWLIPGEGVPEIILQLPKDFREFKELHLNPQSKQVNGHNLASTISEFEAKWGPRTLYAFQNVDKAKSADWFVVFKGADIPEGLLERYPEGHMSKQSMIKPMQSEYLVLAGQTKRYRSTKFKVSQYWEEYNKIRSILSKFGPFILVVVTDSPHVDPVPEDLRPFVFCIAGKDLQYFLGPTVSERRALALKCSA